MTRVLGTVIAGLLGLAFGSFLNVCVSRWPKGESVVKPRSFCEGCGRTLAWWENVPLLSWMALRGRCRTCGTWIGWRTVVVEVAMGGSWAMVAWDSLGALAMPQPPNIEISIADAIARMVFYWLLVALAALDAENLWLPDRLTLPGIGLGFVTSLLLTPLDKVWWSQRMTAREAAIDDVISIAVACCLVLAIRGLYWLVRRKEGLGLGDVKLMGMLAAWLWLPGALFAFAVGVVLGAMAAVVFIIARPQMRESGGWAAMKLPLGTFLCIGGIVSGLWGEQIIYAYLRWAGF